MAVGYTLVSDYTQFQKFVFFDHLAIFDQLLDRLPHGYENAGSAEFVDMMIYGAHAYGGQICHKERGVERTGVDDAERQGEKFI